MVAWTPAKPVAPPHSSSDANHIVTPGHPPACCAHYERRSPLLDARLLPRPIAFISLISLANNCAVLQLPLLARNVQNVQEDSSMAVVLFPVRVRTQMTMWELHGRHSCSVKPRTNRRPHPWTGLQVQTTCWLMSQRLPLEQLPTAATLTAISHSDCHPTFLAY